MYKMKIIDLTMPIYEGMPCGTLWPYERAVVIESPLTWEKHGLRLDNLTMFCEPGTRLVMPSLGASRKDEPKVDEIDLNKIILRDTVVIDVPKKANEVITLAEVEAAFQKADVHSGDAVLLRTGWGDDERYYKMGEEYVLQSPYYAKEATARLAEMMKEKGCDLFFYDTANMGLPKVHLIPEWVKAQPRKEGWPSAEAKAYVDAYTTEKIIEDWEGVLPMGPARIVAIGCIVNCGAITKSRVKTTSLPLKIRGAAVTPCSVIAIEE